jgi:hypothetical protein
MLACLNEAVVSDAYESDWPEILREYPFIDDYTKNKFYENIDKLREEYIFFLSFLDEAIVFVEKT